MGDINTKEEIAFCVATLQKLLEDTNWLFEIPEVQKSSSFLKLLDDCLVQIVMNFNAIKKRLKKHPSESK
jgi:hypothetical protein